MKTKHCKYCGGDINPLVACTNQQYCSEVCRKKAHVERQYAYLERERVKQQSKYAKHIIDIVRDAIDDRKDEITVIETILDNYSLKKYNKRKKKGKTTWKD